MDLFGSKNKSFDVVSEGKQEDKVRMYDIGRGFRVTISYKSDQEIGWLECLANFIGAKVRDFGEEA